MLCKVCLEVNMCTVEMSSNIRNYPGSQGVFHGACSTFVVRLVWMWVSYAQEQSHLLGV